MGTARMHKGLLTFTLASLMAGSALASTLHTLPGKTKPVLVWDVADAAVFQRYNDLWLVTSDPAALQVNIPEADAKTLGITGQEVLQVRGGQGLRLSFKKIAGVEALQKEGRFEFDLTARPAPVQQLLSFTRGPQNLQWTAPRAGKMLRAFSPLTKETYPALTTTAPAGVRQAEVRAGVQFLPSVLGAALVSRQGQPMQITGDATQGFSLDLVPPKPAAKTAPPQGTYGQVLADLAALFPLPKTTHGDFTGALVQLQNAVVEARRVTQMLAQQEGAGHTLAAAPVAPSLPPLENAPLTTEDITPPPPAAPAALLPTPEVMATAVHTESLARVAARYGALSFAAATHELTAAFVKASTAEARQQAVMEWAGMMFAFERYAEAIGLLQTLPQDPATQLPMLAEARLMEVAASMMLGRVDDAAGILKTITSSSPQFRLWQAVLDVERGNAAEAMAGFRTESTALADYPMPLRRQLEVWALTAAFEAENYADIPPQAQVIIDRDAEATLPRVRLLTAQAQQKLGRKEDARAVFTALQKSLDPQVRVEADIAVTSLALDNGDITVDDALVAFEKARFDWRGDRVEQDLTFNLANLYLKNSHYLEALELFKYYTTVFPQGNHVAEAARLMTEVFNQLFTTDLAEQVLDPLTQLALYFEFKELTPPGPQGDAIMSRVVRKLADTSLYPRAIELLERLITFRLQGAAEKAEAGLTLAELHYANRSFTEGLKALEMTATKSLIPTSLLERRHVMEGRLHQAMGRQEEALQAVQALKTKPADYLRAAVAWAGDDYAEVSRLLAPYFQDRAAAATWKTDDHVALLQLALAYALQHQAADLARLYTNFTQEIGVLNLDGAFQFLRDLAGEATPTPQTADVWQSLLNALGTVRGFEDFYDKFRQQRFTGAPDPTPAL